ASSTQGRPCAPRFPYTTLVRSVALLLASCSFLDETLLPPLTGDPAPSESAPTDAKTAQNLSPEDIRAMTPSGYLRGRDSALFSRSEEHTSELQSRENLVCGLPL